MNQYPILIICRDRLSCLLQLLNWLEGAGHERIYLMDNDSTYEPLLEYYETTPHQVVRLGFNSGHTGIWNTGYVDKIAGDEHFVVTDPDVIPVEECPLDAVDYFRGILDRHADRTKAGFTLKIDDLPDHFKYKKEVIRHESQYANWGGPEPRCNFAPIDTTFALYKPHAQPDISYSVRTTKPYEARHLPWYIDTSNLDDEELYYRQHANPDITSWNKDDLPGWLK